MLTRPGFTIEMDAGRRLMKVTMRGFWDDATIEAYDAETRVAGAALRAEAGCGTSDMLVLVDARDLSAQSQALLSEYKSRFAAPERQTKRNATLVSSALFKRQVERLAIPNQRIFENEREAMDWLLAD